MPLSPDDLKARYDRLSLQLKQRDDRGRFVTKSQLQWLAKRDGQSPTEWLEAMISKAFEREQRKAKKDPSKG